MLFSHNLSLPSISLFFNMNWNTISLLPHLPTTIFSFVLCCTLSFTVFLNPPSVVLMNNLVHLLLHILLASDLWALIPTDALGDGKNEVKVLLYFVEYKTLFYCWFYKIWQSKICCLKRWIFFPRLEKKILRFHVPMDNTMQMTMSNNFQHLSYNFCCILFTIPLSFFTNIWSRISPPSHNSITM